MNSMLQIILLHYQRLTVCCRQHHDFNIFIRLSLLPHSMDILTIPMFVSLVDLHGHSPWLHARILRLTTVRCRSSQSICTSKENLEREPCIWLCSLFSKHIHIKAIAQSILQLTFFIRLVGVNVPILRYLPSCAAFVCPFAASSKSS